jgi:hypothetical protein
MFFVSNLLSSSQAGRRGFEPHLPLHLFNSLGTFHVLSIKLPVTSRGRLDGFSGTFQPNPKSPRIASVQKSLDIRQLSAPSSDDD